MNNEDRLHPLLIIISSIIITILIFCVITYEPNDNTDYENDFQIASSIVYSEINENSTSSEIIESIKSNCELYTDYTSNCEKSIKKVYRDIMLDKLEQERINNKL